jgi:hypothetical protein
VKLNQHVQELNKARHWCLTPVIPATQEAAIGRIMVQSQSTNSLQDTISKTLHKKKNILYIYLYIYIYKAGGVAQGEGPEFKSQYCKKKRKNE